MKVVVMLMMIGVLLAGCAAVTPPKLPLLESQDTITDTESGLIWARNVNQIGNYSSPDSINKIEACSSGLTSPETCLQYLNNMKFAGYNCWRLPTRPEFERLIDMSKDYQQVTSHKGAATPVFYIITQKYIGFRGVQGYFFVSDGSTGRKDVEDYIFFDSLREAFIPYTKKGGYADVWPVCGPSNTPKYLYRFSPSSGSADVKQQPSKKARKN